MITFISLLYASFYFLVFGKGFVAKTGRNISIFVGVGVVLIGTIVFSWLTVAPTTQDGRVFQFVIPIVPKVAGAVIEVPAEPLVPMREGDILFRIEPDVFQATVDRFEASIEQVRATRRLAQIEVDRNTELVKRSAAAQRELDSWTAQRDGANASIRSLQAQLANAQWELEQTNVRAPHDGYIVNLQVRPGTAVRTFAATPAMSYVSDEIKEIVASFSQSSIRKLRVGDPAEMVFALFPGEVFAGKVSHIIKATGTAQLGIGGTIPIMTGAPATARYVVRISLDDPEMLDRLPQGASCSVAVYASVGKPFHVISMVAMRITAWMAYLTSPA